MFERLQEKDVNSPETFARYCQQRTGIPYPTGKQIAVLKKGCKEFFAEYPHASWSSLCRVVDWALAKRMRYSDAGRLVSGGLRYAYADGYLPELDPNYMVEDLELEQKIQKAMEVETDKQWVRRLTMSSGVEARREVYEAWLQTRA